MPKNLRSLDFSNGICRALLSAPCALRFSSDDSVGSGSDIRWNSKSDLLGGFQIDDEVELRRLLDGQVSGFSAFQYLVHIVSTRLASRTGVSGDNTLSR